MDFKLEYCFSLQDFGMRTNSVVNYYIDILRNKLLINLEFENKILL